MKLWHWLRCLAGFHRLRWVRNLSMGCALLTCPHCGKFFAFNPRIANGIGACLEFDWELYLLHRDGGDRGLEPFLRGRLCREEEE